MAGFICISTQKQAICQSLNCLIKYLYIEEGMVRNAFFGPSFLSFSLGGLFFPTFYSISLTLWFSLRFWQCRQFQCHRTRGWKPYFRNNRGCKRTAFSEANSSVHLIYSTQKHSLIGQALPPRVGVASGAQPGGSLGPAVSLAYPSLPAALCDPMGCSPPGSSVHGILQARMQE